MAALVSKEKPNILNNLEFPISTAWSARETPKFVNDINKTFGFNTSMMDRFGLYVLFLNINKLEPIVTIIIAYYNEQNKTKLNLKDIKVGLQKLNSSSNVPFIKGGDGNTNHIKNIIKMLMWLIGEIIFLVCLSNSLHEKVDNSVALNAFKEFNKIQECQHKNKLPVPVEYIKGKLEGYSLYDESVTALAINMIQCYNTNNVYESAMELVIPKEDMETRNRETTKQQYMALPNPDDENNNSLVPYGIDLFNDKDTPRQKYNKIIQFLDDIIETDDTQPLSKQTDDT